MRAVERLRNGGVPRNPVFLMPATQPTVARVYGVETDHVCTIYLSLAKPGEAMPGPYISLMVLRRRREAAAEGSGCLKKTDLRGLWEIYCRPQRHCAMILSYMAK